MEQWKSDTRGGRNRSFDPRSALAPFSAVYVAPWAKRPMRHLVLLSSIHVSVQVTCCACGL